jgi:hypothetical protein
MGTNEFLNVLEDFFSEPSKTEQLYSEYFPLIKNVHPITSRAWQISYEIQNELEIKLKTLYEKDKLNFIAYLKQKLERITNLRIAIIAHKDKIYEDWMFFEKVIEKCIDIENAKTRLNIYDGIYGIVERVEMFFPKLEKWIEERIKELEYNSWLEFKKINSQNQDSAKKNANENIAQSNFNKKDVIKSNKLLENPDSIILPFDMHISGKNNLTQLCHYWRDKGIIGEISVTDFRRVFDGKRTKSVIVWKKEVKYLKSFIDCLMSVNPPIIDDCNQWKVASSYFKQKDDLIKNSSIRTSKYNPNSLPEYITDAIEILKNGNSI